MDSDMNHTVRDVVIVPLLPVVNKGFVLFAPGVVVGVHVTYWVKNISSLPSRQALIGGAAAFQQATLFLIISWAGGLRVFCGDASFPLLLITG